MNKPVLLWSAPAALIIVNYELKFLANFLTGKMIQ